MARRIADARSGRSHHAVTRVATAAASVGYYVGVSSPVARLSQSAAGLHARPFTGERVGTAWPHLMPLSRYDSRLRAVTALTHHWPKLLAMTTPKAEGYTPLLISPQQRGQRSMLMRDHFYFSAISADFSPLYFISDTGLGAIDFNSCRKAL